MPKLTDSKQFEGNLVHAWTEPCYRRIIDPRDRTPEYEYNDERFQFIIDERDEVLATVTDQYTLVTNRDLVSAVDLAADGMGIRMEANRGEYANGRSYFRVILPDLELQVPGDSSVTRCSIDIQNDYRGGGSLKLLAGWFRLICTNGMVVGEIASQDIKRHTGKIDLMAFATGALQKVQDRFEAERLIALELQDHPLPGPTHPLIVELLKSTADRYAADLMLAIAENGSALGHNLWALSQAVSQVATHRMQQRADGMPRTGFNGSADVWATQQYNRIREYAGV